MSGLKRVTMLELRDLIFRYNGKTGHAIGPISFRLGGGETLGLLGPSGCGKTTVLRVIAGLLPRRGSDCLDGSVEWVDGTGRPPAERRISLMFQQTVLLPHMTVA